MCQQQLKKRNKTNVMKMGINNVCYAHNMICICMDLLDGGHNGAPHWREMPEKQCNTCTVGRMSLELFVYLICLQSDEFHRQNFQTKNRRAFIGCVNGRVCNKTMKLAFSMHGTDTSHIVITESIQK